jgi:hypothetical protein
VTKSSNPERFDVGDEKIERTPEVGAISRVEVNIFPPSLPMMNMLGIVFAMD